MRDIIFLTIFGTSQSQFRKENRGAADKLFCLLIYEIYGDVFLEPNHLWFPKIAALETAKRVGVLKKLENEGSAKFKSRKLQEWFNIYRSFFERIL